MSVNKRVLLTTSLVLAITVLTTVIAFSADLTAKEQLGKLIFFDTRLSTPHGMSCASCHDPQAGFADPRPDYPTSQGIIPNRFGSRNAPTVAYASFSPKFFINPNMGPMNKGVYEG